MRNIVTTYEVLTGPGYRRAGGRRALSAGRADLLSIANMPVEELDDAIDRGIEDGVPLVASVRPLGAELIGVLGMVPARPLRLLPGALQQLVELAKDALEVIVVPADHQEGGGIRDPLDALPRDVELDLVVRDVAAKLHPLLDAEAGAVLRGPVRVVFGSSLVVKSEEVDDRGLGRDERGGPLP